MTRRRHRERRFMDPETPAEMFDDGTDGDAMMAAEACGMEFGDFIARDAPGWVRARKPPAKGAAAAIEKLEGKRGE
jgi:hypothetical protein